MLKSFVIVCFVFLLAIVACLADRCDYILTNKEDRANKEDRVTCAYVQAEVSFQFHYIDSSHNNVTKAVGPLPCGNLKLDSSSSSCNNDTLNDNMITMKYDWTNGSYNGSIEFEFTEDTKDHQWSMSNLTVTVDEASSKLLFPNSSNNITGPVEGSVNGDIVVNTNLDYQRSFQCKAEQQYWTPSSIKDITMNIVFVNLQLQAFQFKDNATFGNVYKCDADMTGSKIVPIAVGAALAGLVVVVLIAYIIGRIRSRRQSSYEALS